MHLISLVGFEDVNHKAMYKLIPPICPSFVESMLKGKMPNWKISDLIYDS